MKFSVLHVKIRISLLRLLVCVFVVLATETPSQAEPSPWTKNNIAKILRSLVENQKIEFKTLEKLIEDSGKSITDEKIKDQMKNLDPGDSIWSFYYKRLATNFIIAGKPENIHTINILFAPVNTNNAQDEIKIFFPALFKSLLPTWEGATNWPIESLKKSWTAIASRDRKKNKKYSGDFIITATYKTIQLSTAGVPPDFVIFRLSNRPECDLRRNVEKIFKRWVC